MNLSNKNLDLAIHYFLGDTTALDQKDDDFRNIFLAYATDSNSSSLREAVTLRCLEYQSYDSKHGADGIDPKTGRKKEVKPRFLVEGKRLGSSGNFNDMTMELLEKKKDFDIVCSLFYEDSLIYIVEFPISVIWEQLKKPIINAKLGKRVVCPFSYKHYCGAAELKIHYFNLDAVNKTNCISKQHSLLLESKYNK